MSLGTERVEEIIFDLAEKAEAKRLHIMPEKIQELILRRSNGSDGKPTTVFAPDGYPQDLSADEYSAK